ncbi:MAG: ribosome small subunit-dependent GTPase A [Desulfobacterales bacterium]|nr:ribosome small subunit-dependent GTPase A [Desulfobacterales bacterium]
MLKKYGLEKLIKKGFNEENCGFLARITAQHNKIYSVICSSGEKSARVSGRFIHESKKISNFPVVGDWVILREGSEDQVIESIVPRINQISRSAAGKRYSRDEISEEQVIAANVDNVFIVSALDRDFNLRRIERYLTLSYNSGAKPFIILNKEDLCDDIESYITEIESIAFGVPVIPVSAVNQENLSELYDHLISGETSVLVGSSGVGKSTLINAFMGDNTQKVKDISSSVKKGVHTTTHRELFLLENGSILIDNPGMRELGLVDGNNSIKDVFREIEELGKNCKFNDCSHMDEPGCAVKFAISEGILSKERFSSYLKLKSELDYLKMKDSKSSEAIEKDKWKDIKKQIRRHYSGNRGK